MIKDYGTNYKKIIEDLDNQQEVSINEKQYKELLNVVYEVDYFENNIVTALPNEVDDQLEREYLIRTLINSMNCFTDEKNSRRLVFSNLYSNKLCKCISLVAVFIRDDKFYIDIFIRSQNFIKNFKFDCETMALLMRVGIISNLKPGKITVLCVNLHKEIVNG